MEDHGCDAGGQPCGGGSLGSNAIGDAGYQVGTDGSTPVPDIKRVTINGAPVSEASHEYVVCKRDAPDTA